VVADALEQRPLFAAGGGEFDQRLQELMEQRVAAQPARIEVFIDAHHVACASQMHQAMHLVDQGRGFFTGAPHVAVIAHALSDALVPRTQSHLAAAALFSLALRERVGVRAVALVEIGLIF